MKKLPNKYDASRVLAPRQETAAEQGYGQHRLYTGQHLRHQPSGIKGAALCSRCRAVYSHKYWFVDIAKARSLEEDPDVRLMLCPGCRRVENQDYEGEVILKGSSLFKNKDPLFGLIKHIEGKCWHDNARSRIASISEESDQIKILTTTRWLATRIGKEVYKAHKGKLEIVPAPEEKFVRVYWSDESEGEINHES